MESQGLDGFSLESLLCHTPKWYFSRSEIDDDSPSRKDSINLKTESQLRATYCSFLQDLGKRLNAPQATIATAMMLCHRFYMHQSHARNGWQTIATVSMFLACKAEETPRFLRDVIMVAYGMLHRSDPAAAQRINHKDVYQRQKELILTGERLLLTTVAFDLNIQHPYKPLVGALKRLKISDNHLVKVAWNFVNDWLRTTLCLQYKPHYIAAGSMYLAARFLKVKLPSEGGKVWWMEFDISPLRLDDKLDVQRLCHFVVPELGTGVKYVEVIQQMLELLGQNKGPAVSSSQAKPKQASVGVKGGPSDGQQSSTPITSIITSDSTQGNATGNGESRKQKGPYIGDWQSIPHNYIRVSTARSGETPHFQTSDCGSSQSTIEDGGRSDEVEIQTATAISAGITICQTISNGKGFNKVDEDSRKEMLKKRSYGKVADIQSAVALEFARPEDSWITKEMKGGVEQAYASEEKRWRLI
ncbi:hypothetical protein Scep_020584 [Stephania cephalantha]|uniref:Cyclin-like domain-containing protein n=1 Tax=Stephania cephalantha TaxID=152367 RepID=A0AAP0NPF7_9MAGN